MESWTAEDPAFPLAHRHPLGVEVLHQGDGVLPAHPEEVLDVRRSDLPLLPEMGDHLVPDLLEHRRVEEERLLHAQEATIGHQELEELVPFRSLDTETSKRLFGARGSGSSPTVVLFEAIDHPLLLRRQPYCVGAQPNLVALAPDHPFGLESGEELG